MKCLRVSCLLVVLLLFLAQGFTQQHSAEILPDDFSTRAFTHIIHLAQMGHRQVGTENDRRSVQYIQKEFENMNIGVEIQPFDFESFEYTNVFFEVEDKQFDVVGLGFNPYKNRREYEGTALLIDLNDAEIHYTQEEIKGKSIITNDWNGHFRLLVYKPELIIYVDSLGFEKLKSQDDLSYKLSIEGENKMYQSANVIGSIGNISSISKEILVTAHYDTYRKNNPGASDNASGVGVMLEMAQYCKRKVKSNRFWKNNGNRFMQK